MFGSVYAQHPLKDQQNQAVSTLQSFPSHLHPTSPAITKDSSPHSECDAPGRWRPVCLPLVVERRDIDRYCNWHLSFTSEWRWERQESTSGWCENDQIIEDDKRPSPLHWCKWSPGVDRGPLATEGLNTSSVSAVLLDKQMGFFFLK